MSKPKRLLHTAMVAAPFMMMYVILRVEAFKNFGMMEDVMAMLIIGCGSTLLSNLMRPRDQDGEDRS